ncbi:MAG: GNAT family N-acetyltransferase [Bacteroidia bacterium]|nr:GNAT family N-acetyltransferase [Bacteroidia bacterium]
MEVSLSFVKKICPKSEAIVTPALAADSVISGVSANGISYSVYDSLAALHGTSWDELVHDQSLFLSRSYLKALESCHDKELNLWYVIFSEAGKDIGAAVFQLVEFQARPLGENLDNRNVVVRVVSKQMGLQTKPLSYKLLVCGNCFATGEHGFTFCEEVPHNKAVAALEESSRAIEKSLGRGTKISGFFYKDFFPESAPFSGNLSKHSFSSFPSEDTLVMTIDPDWKNFDDYLEDLVSKFRVKAKRALTKSEPLTIRDLTLTDLRQHRARIHELYWNVVGKAGFRMGSMNTKVFEVLREEMGEDYVIKGYFLQDQLIGFMCGFKHADMFDATCVGLDYELNQEYQVYSRILYDYVAIAIAKGASHINFGRTAGEIKTTVGAVPVQMACYLRHRRALPNQIIKLVVPFIKPEKFPVREPFKTTWYEKNGIKP